MVKSTAAQPQRQWPSAATWSAIAAIGSLITAVLMLKTQLQYNGIADQMLQSTARPYLSVEWAANPQKNAEKKLFVYVPMIRNVGTVLARDVTFDGAAVFNGAPTMSVGFPHTSYVLFPQQTLTQAGQLVGNSYDQVVSGAPLEVTIDVAYKGATDRVYHTHSKFRYEPQENVMVSIENSSD